MKNRTDLGKLILSMGIFGTIGIFRRYLPYPSSFIAAARGLIGAIAILLLLFFRRDRIDLRAARQKWLPLLLSGVCLGGNWVLLFEAYRYTSVSVATICYYMAPLFAALAAPIFFKDRLTTRKVFCIALSCAGMVLVSGVLDTGLRGMTGILLGLSAAVLYACVVLLNRAMPELRSFDRTIVQLLVSAVAVGIYTLCTEDLSQLTFQADAVLLLLVVGIVHTGVAYSLYFASMKSLPTQTVAIFSYLDPILSILLSAWILKEPLTGIAICGIVMVLGGAFLSEFSRKSHE